VKLLLDTQVVLWWLLEPSKIRSPIRRKIAAADVVFVSAASVWETQIKAGLGRLAIPKPLSTVITDEGFLELPVTIAHAEALSSLPALHKDPFDRLLVAQATAETLTLVSPDPEIARYGVATLWR
jgi:PIN domain nuclease of toxin-antitoxin system